MRRWIKGILIGLLIGLGGALLGLSPLGTQFELNVGKAWLFNIRGELSPPENVVIVGINGQTSEQLSLPSLPRDWPRTIHAKLVEKLVKLGAAVIVFDVFFESPKIAKDDTALAKVINDAGRVVLVEKLTGKRQPISDSEGHSRGVVWVEGLLPPLEPFAKAAKGLAPFPLPKIDAAVHDFWMFKNSAGNAPTMPVMAMQLYELDSYTNFLSLLQQLRIPGWEQLPSTSAEIGKNNQLGAIMIRIRNWYEKNPNLRDKMDELIYTQYAGDNSLAMRNRLLALNSLYGGQSQRFINFYGAPGSIPTVPFQAVINGDASKYNGVNFRDKIVFVGFSDLYDPGQPDRFYSVFTNNDGIDLSGVEIAATACANLLTDKTISLAPMLQAGLALFIFGMLMGGLIYIYPAIAGVPISIALAAAYVVAAQWGFSTHNYWMPLATPLLVQFPLALFLGLMGQYFLERHRGQRISETLKYYVPENIAKELTENRLDPSAANKVVYSTCLATDMAGFSTLAEQLPPNELAKVLNDYFDTLAQPLKKHHVDVTEFRADAIMCAWTAAKPDIAVRQKAVMAALDAVDAIRLFKERYSQINTSIRIGLESGTVYVGHAGGGGHFVFSIVGDCANTASRVESLNKHLKTNLLATGAVVEGLENLLLRPLSRFQFVGKTEALPIVEIVSAFDSASNEQREFCERFAAALEPFHQAQWQKAESAFTGFLERYPNDGPTAYYIALCRRYLASGVQIDDPYVIRMDSK